MLMIMLSIIAPPLFALRSSNRRAQSLGLIALVIYIVGWIGLICEPNHPFARWLLAWLISLFVSLYGLRRWADQ